MPSPSSSKKKTKRQRLLSHKTVSSSTESMNSIISSQQEEKENILTNKLRDLLHQNEKRYLPGENVQQIDAVLIKGVDRAKGEVVRQDSGSHLVFVAWENGCKYWTDIQCLEPVPEKRKKSKG